MQIIALKSSGHALSMIEATLTAFFLGMAHALEPGHGKTAMIAYFIDGKKNHAHSLIIGLASGISHSLSILAVALLVHGAAYFALKKFEDHTQDESLRLISLVGGGILLIVGAFLIVKAIMIKSHTQHTDACCDHSLKKSHKHLLLSPKAKKADTHQFSLTALIGASIGIYPCPTAIAAYLSAVATGSYHLGYIAIFTYAFGTAAAIGAMGYFATSIGRKLRNRGSILKILGNQKLMFFLQGIIILALGSKYLYEALIV